MRKKKIPKGARRISARFPSKKKKNPAVLTEREAALAELTRQYRQAAARINRTHDERSRKVKYALKKFRPRKGERGKIVFIGPHGGRIPLHSSRRGYAVYVDRKGRKTVIRQFSGKNKKLEKTAIPRKLNSIDLTRSPSKRAKKMFLTARANPVAGRELRKKGKGISSKGTLYAGKLTTDKFYAKADCVAVLAKELCAASNSQRSKRDFLVTIGIHVHEASGARHWIETQQRFSRQDSQKADFYEVKEFFGRQVYAFLARELADRGLVLAGSARHIGRLSENKKRRRAAWTKDGFLWAGADCENVKIESMEYRFDQLILTK